MCESVCEAWSNEHDQPHFFLVVIRYKENDVAGMIVLQSSSSSDRHGQLR